ncbi:MAG: TrmH family RNA methyltransferase [Thioalkalispiraceae bacterium]|jgi:tRNA G18 (ribose-2'-O)-methylase SpoU
MGLRQLNRIKRQQRERALQRYHKEKQRNLLAQPGCKSFIIVLDHLKGGFNVPKIFRSAEAFGCHEVHLVNVEPFDPAPAKGTFRKVPTRYHANFEDCYAQLEARGYRLFALQASCSNNLATTALPEKSAFILGNEGLGHSFNRENYPAIDCLSIPHFGVTESLNVSVAASIVMYEYTRQYR